LLPRSSDDADVGFDCAERRGEKRKGEKGRRTYVRQPYYSSERRGKKEKKKEEEKDIDIDPDFLELRNRAERGGPKNSTIHQ